MSIPNRQFSDNTATITLQFFAELNLGDAASNLIMHEA